MQVKVIVVHTELARTRKLTQTGQHFIRDEMVTKMLIVFPHRIKTVSWVSWCRLDTRDRIHAKRQINCNLKPFINFASEIFAAFYINTLMIT